MTLLFIFCLHSGPICLLLTVDELLWLIQRSWRGKQFSFSHLRFRFEHILVSIAGCPVRLDVAQVDTSVGHRVAGVAALGSLQHLSCVGLRVVEHQHGLRVCDIQNNDSQSQRSCSSSCARHHPRSSHRCETALTSAMPRDVFARSETHSAVRADVTGRGAARRLGAALRRVGGMPVGHTLAIRLVLLCLLAKEVVLVVVGAVWLVVSE